MYQNVGFEISLDSFLVTCSHCPLNIVFSFIAMLSNCLDRWNIFTMSLFFLTVVHLLEIISHFTPLEACMCVCLQSSMDWIFIRALPNAPRSCLVFRLIAIFFDFWGNNRIWTKGRILPTVHRERLFCYRKFVVLLRYSDFFLSLSLSSGYYRFLVFYFCVIMRFY